VRAGTGGEPPKSPIHLDFVEWWLYLLSTVPPLLFFTVATVLVACWTKVWIDSNELAESWVKAVRIACGVANALLYSANALYIVAAYAVWPAPDGVAPQQIVPLWLYVAAFALVSFGCLLVGWVIHRELSKVPIRLAIRVRKVRQIFVVTFVTFACFFARAIAVAVLAATPAKDIELSSAVRARRLSLSPAPSRSLSRLLRLLLSLSRSLSFVVFSPSIAFVLHLTRSSPLPHFMYRYISRESCSQFDSLPLSSLTISFISLPPPPLPALSPMAHQVWATVGAAYYVLLEIAPCVALLLYFCRTPVRLSRRQAAMLDRLESNLLLPFDPSSRGAVVTRGAGGVAAAALAPPPANAAPGPAATSG
jgi:hypothetical protein